MKRPDIAGERGLGALTAAQSLLWTGQLDPESPLYNMAVAFSIDGPLDIDLFGKAFQKLVDGCDALRARFERIADGQRRRVVERQTAPVEFHDFSAEVGAEAELLARLVERTKKILPMDEPLFDSALFRLGPERFVWYFNQHHLATDAWSTTLLFRRMSELYGLAQDNRLDEAPTWPSYEEFAAHEQRALASRHGASATEHWRREAETHARPTRFYGGVSQTRSGAGRRVAVSLGSERSQALRALAETEGFRAITPDLALSQVFSTVLLAFLGRVADQSGPGFSAPSHNRGSAKLRETAGLLVELFPLSVAIEEGETFASLAAKTAEANQQRLMHAVAGTSVHAPARDVILNYIKGGFEDFAGLPMRAEWIHSGSIDRAHKLRLQVYDFDRTGEFRLEMDLNDEVFGEREARWAVDHFLKLTDALLADPLQPIAAPALTTAAEVAEFAPATKEKAAPPSVTRMFADQAARTPDATAVVDGDRAISYQELRERVRRLAGRLRREGVGPDERVAVLLPRSADLIVALLGVLEAGAAYVPLDPAYPRERLAFMAADASVKLATTTPELREEASRFARKTLTVASDSSEPAEDPASPVSEDRLAYVLYTSGSTGRPKGVMITRAALANYVAWARDQYIQGRALSFPLFTSPAFDLTVTSIFTPLVSGGSVVVYGADSDDAFTIRRVAEDDRVDVVKLTPSHLALIRDQPLDRSRIRTLILGGEDLPTELAAAAHDAFGGRVALYNEYGPTETTVGCMIHRYDPEQDREASVPIGRPADNVRIYVLDRYRQPTPRGVVGQIAIAGAGVARGYLNLEERTRKSFVADPFRPGETMYLSGDLGRWNRDGVLEFLGRRDMQVKWRGARIELGEVEAALAAFPGVRQCAAALVQPRRDRTALRRCIRCGLEDAHPEARLDADGVCAVCRRFEGERERVADYFGSIDELQHLLAEARQTSIGPHDCLMLFSGGKDSTYALCKIVDMGARPLVFLLDNGYISEQAQANVRRVVDELGLELVVGRTPAMDRIFTDSLKRYSNVCNGCFKTIYTLATNLARERGIRTIVTGLSRGQIFETRLADLYRRRIFDRERIDRMVLEGRKVYHRMDDEVARSLDVEIFQDDAVFDEIRFLDFYRYCDVSLEEVLAYIGRRTPWVRPSDTGRSTNCQVNEVGIFVHIAERGFHNYALPYSWDVRLGHKQRDAAVAELDDRIDVAGVREKLHRLGYRESAPADAADVRLAAYYAADEEVSASELRRFLADKLPPEAIPAMFVRLDALPLTANGKVDRSALPKPEGRRPVLEKVYIEPRSPAEIALAEVWAETLDLDRVGVDDNFFELGGDSIQCIQVVSSARRRGWAITPQQLFAHPTVGVLASAAVQTEPAAAAPRSSSAEVSEAELAEVLDELGETAG